MSPDITGRGALRTVYAETVTRKATRPQAHRARRESPCRLRCEDSADRINLFTKDGQEWVKFDVNPLQDNRSVTIP